MGLSSAIIPTRIMDIETQRQLSQFSDFHNKAFMAPFIFGGCRFGRAALSIEGIGPLPGHLARRFVNERRKASAMICRSSVPERTQSAPVQPI
jgi:hypothetical protein